MKTRSGRYYAALQYRDAGAPRGRRIAMRRLHEAILPELEAIKEITTDPAVLARVARIRDILDGRPAQAESKEG